MQLLAGCLPEHSGNNKLQGARARQLLRRVAGMMASSRIMFGPILTTVILLITCCCPSRAESSATEVACQVSQSDGKTTFTIQYKPELLVEDCTYSWVNRTDNVFANQEESFPGLVVNHTARQLITSLCLDVVRYVGTCGSMYSALCTTNCTETNVENEADILGQNRSFSVILLVFLLLLWWWS